MPFEEDLPNDPFDDSVKAAPDTEDLLKSMDSPEPKNKPMQEIHAMLDYRKQSMADVGTRYQHLSDLLVQWEDTAQMMKKRSFLGRDELFKLAGIEMAIKQLKKTIETMQDYGEMVEPIRSMINQVPKAFTIYGGRGTPLRPWVPDTDEEMS
jgi:hypothetical protein